MMMQVCCAIDIELWVVWWFLASIGVHVVAPVATGILCGRSFDWISPTFGFFIGFVMIAPGLGLFILWYWSLVELFGFYLASEPLVAWVSLPLLAVVQVLAVLGTCWLINRRRDQHWGISWM